MIELLKFSKKLERDDFWKERYEWECSGKFITGNLKDEPFIKIFILIAFQLNPHKNLLEKQFNVTEIEGVLA